MSGRPPPRAAGGERGGAPIVGSARVVVIAGVVSCVASLVDLPFMLTSGLMAALFPITSARPTLETLATAAGGAAIALGATWGGVGAARVINLGVKAHEHRKRAGDGTVGVVSCILCVLLVAVSAEAASGRPTRGRLQWAACVNCALLGCGMSVLGEMMHSAVAWMRLGKWGWATVLLAIGSYLYVARPPPRDDEGEDADEPQTPRGAIPSTY